MRILIVILILLSCGVAWATDYTQDANCQGAWLFKEGSGTTVDDSSVNNNIGNFKGAGEPLWASMSGTGNPSYSPYIVTFDGSNDYINCGSDTSLDYYTGGRAYTCWIYPITFQNGVQARRILSKNSTVGAFWRFYTVDTATFAFQAVNFSSTTYVQVIANNNTLTASQWNHVALSWDGSTTATNCHLYKNGVEVGYATQTNGSGTLRDDSANDFWIGNDAGSDTTRSFNGSMTEVGVFNRIITSTEINDIKDNGLKGQGKPQYKMYIMDGISIPM